MIFLEQLLGVEILNIFLLKQLASFRSMYFQELCEGKQYIYITDGNLTFTATSSQGTESFMQVLAECTLLQKPCQDTPILRPPACLLINTNRSLQPNKSRQLSGIWSI